MGSESFKFGFFNALKILKNYLPEIIIGGGWVPFLYYRYLVADKNKQALFTKDIDLLVKENLPVVKEKTVDQLLTEAGLESAFKSRDNPPLIHYEGNIEGFEVEIEFLTDQKGSRPDTVIKVQEGLHAEALRFLSILVENTINLELGDVEPPLSIKVPSPEAFILNKGLVFPRRRDRLKSAKDLYYVFDILSTCTQLRPEIINGLNYLQQKYPVWFGAFVKNIGTTFADIDSEGVLMVLSQRPSGAFLNMQDDQLRQYILGIFLELLGDLNTVSA
ncbi:MAG: GSU2403 family nucleotidyltransferase fold protein [Thermodesulfobacteriota bacterium]|nr:GSU2403 family nucleotidyltransferase fold protein [Thermodesulfobacteriota bacterium]